MTNALMPVDEPNGDGGGKLVFQALWRKKSGKKNKTWEGDGVATLNAGNLVLKSDSKTLFRISCQNASEGDIFGGGIYECELGSLIELSSKSSQASQASQASQVSKVSKVSQSSQPSQSKPKPKPRSPMALKSSLKLENVSRGASIQNKSESTSLEDLLSAPLPRVGPVKRVGLPMAPQAKKAPNIAKLPTVTDLMSQSAPKSQATTLRKPAAVVSDGLVIDSELMEHLRPHQIEAVNFLFDCVTGKRHSYGQGALLADEMGLGKTLTSIALIFSMLKANIIKNCLVVCPVTLLRNWKNEFKKWLGETRIGVFTATPDTDVANFFKTSFKTYQVMIAGYERIVRIADDLAAGMQPFDLVICDEGHRLKTLNTKCAQAIASISGDRRIILTGTPVQNNLGEFHALADYLNPGIFGSVAKFTRKFSDPVAASRCPGASELAIQNGEDAAEELVEIVNEFVIRRDFRVLEKYVQVPKTEQIVFCRPFASQARLYQSIISSGAISGCLDGSGQGEVLRAISMLRRAATSTLLAPDEYKLERASTAEKSGGKLQVLADFMRQLSSKTSEKVVIVSGSTATLDLVQTMCTNLELQWLRLDGSTPQDQRQQLVDLFNRTSSKRSFAFLLSARSGGAGLNLIGASRLILLDSDWNPAIDLQAMARVFRDGQKRPVFIYRFLTTGTIDEKIFQRQLTKRGLANTVLDLDTGPDKFTKDQLRDLFTFHQPQLCNTLDQGDHENLTICEPDEMLASSKANITCVLNVTN